MTPELRIIPLAFHAFMASIASASAADLYEPSYQPPPPASGEPARCCLLYAKSNAAVTMPARFLLAGLSRWEWRVLAVHYARCCLLHTINRPVLARFLLAGISRWTRWKCGMLAVGLNDDLEPTL